MIRAQEQRQIHYHFLQNKKSEDIFKLLRKGPVNV